LAIYKVKQYEPEGMYIIELYNHQDKFIKNIAECYEEDYAWMIAYNLAKSTGGMVKE